MAMIPYGRQDILEANIQTVADALQSAHGSVVPVLEEGVASL